MDIVSGFNHQNPGDNDKPMIYHEGEDTYVLNKTTGTEGQPLYYGVDRFGRHVEYSAGEMNVPPEPSIVIRATYDTAGLAIRQLTINNTSDREIDLGVDRFSVRYETNNYVYPVCIMTQTKTTRYSIVAFDLTGDHIAMVAFRCGTVVKANDGLPCDVMEQKQYDISSLRM